jgi:hypothetical protein
MRRIGLAVVLGLGLFLAPLSVEARKTYRQATASWFGFATDLP